MSHLAATRPWAGAQPLAVWARKLSAIVLTLLGLLAVSYTHLTLPTICSV